MVELLVHGQFYYDTRDLAISMLGNVVGALEIIHKLNSDSKWMSSEIEKLNRKAESNYNKFESMRDRVDDYIEKMTSDQNLELSKKFTDIFSVHSEILKDYNIEGLKKIYERSLRQCNEYKKDCYTTLKNEQDTMRLLNRYFTADQLSVRGFNSSEIEGYSTFKENITKVSNAFITLTKFKINAITYALRVNLSSYKKLFKTYISGPVDNYDYDYMK